MLQDLPPKREYNDAWETTAREGYEDRGAFRELRMKPKRQGSSTLRMLGGIAIVGGIFWGVWVVTRGGDMVEALRQNYGPVAIIALGAITSVLGKFLRV